MSRLEKHKKLPVFLRDKVVGLLPGVNDKKYNLNISDTHQFIWFRVPKVGTRTILHEFNANQVEFTNIPTRLLNYQSERYQNYFSFAFVRNPWDRIVSCWSNKVVDHNRFGFQAEQYEKMCNFDYFIEYLETIDLDKTDRHVKPQYLSIDLNRVNHIGRFENFAQDLNKVLTILDMKVEPGNLTKQNSSNRQSSDYRHYYNDQTAQKVAKLYAPDIEHFKYTF